MQNRREHDRYTIWFPVTLDAGACEVFAICRDASKRGILIAAATQLEEGTRVKVTFRVTPSEPEERTVEGRVVRIETATGSATWPHKMGIEFDEEIPELERQLVRHSLPPPPGDPAAR